MSERAPPPTGHDPNWLPFIAAVELVLRQVGDPNQAMKDVISAQSSGVHFLVLVHGVRRLVTSTDKIRVRPPIEWDDDGREKLTKEWRKETTIELDGDEVPMFVWRPELEEFCGLRPVAACEEKPPREERPVPEPAVREEKPGRARREAKKRAKKKRLPFLRGKMIIAILCRAFPNGFSDNDITGKTKVVRDGWKAESMAPLGNASRPVVYSPPDRMTVTRTIRDYLKRPRAYLKRS